MDNVIKVIRYYSKEAGTYLLKVTQDDKFITCFLSYEQDKAEQFAHNLAEKLTQKLEEETILTITI
jgi:urease accessory protein UreH